jgi:hypothetical protein
VGLEIQIPGLLDRRDKRKIQDKIYYHATIKPLHRGKLLGWSRPHIFISSEFMRSFYSFAFKALNHYKYDRAAPLPYLSLAKSVGHEDLDEAAASLTSELSAPPSKLRVEPAENSKVPHEPSPAS